MIPKKVRHLVLPAGVVSAALFAGCAREAATRPPVRSWKPIGEQLIDLDPRLRDTPFRVLLGFETDADLAFLGGASGGRRDDSVFHSGPASLALPNGSTSFSVKLSAVLPAASFPNSWTLLGAYFYTKEPVVIGASYEVAGKPLLQRSITLRPRQWTPVMLDVSTLTDPNAPPPPGPGILRFSAAAGAPPIWCDDVMVIENARTLVSGDLPGDGWTVRVRGFNTVIERPGHFALNVRTPDAAPDGWQLEEVNPMRARFSASGGTRAWTVYADGRQYVDGKFSALGGLAGAASAALADQHQSPSEISVPEEMGRVERNSPGDRNNDGYNETNGAYQLKTDGGRLLVTLRPRTAKLIRPVLEIANFPPGRVTGTLEGVLIDRSARLSNGHVLVQLPGAIEREVTVELKVR